MRLLKALCVYLTPTAVCGPYLALEPSCELVLPTLQLCTLNRPLSLLEHDSTLPSYRSAHWGGYVVSLASLGDAAPFNAATPLPSRYIRPQSHISRASSVAHLLVDFRDIHAMSNRESSSDCIYMKPATIAILGGHSTLSGPGVGMPEELIFELDHPVSDGSALCSGA
ncbi:hypothetical protein C8J57DRAFT_1711074 [Mycena rebaudengoi]|nr:hypothetical protein C8J57DRAFT_1711074 [Mycena rebaudengoi]